MLFKHDRTEDASDPAKLLIADHQKVERIFDLLDDDESRAQRAGLVTQLAFELRRHTDLEERIVYPFIRANVQGGEEMIGDAVEEHREARELLAQLEVTDPAGGDFDGVVKALRKAVKHHVKEEEKDLLPKLATVAGEDRLGYLRGQLEREKLAVPERDLPADDGSDVRASGAGSASLSRSSDTGRSGKPDVWVQPHHIHDDRWQVRRDGATRASRVFGTQREAIDFGRQLAAREKVELQIAGRDGQIRIKDSAGR